MKIQLPQYDWFLSKHEGRYVTNTYSGSAGTAGVGGCVGVCTFNYKVYVDASSGNESEFRVVAEAFLLQPWQLGGQRTDFSRAEFVPSENCIAQAEAWLTETAAKLGF